MFRITFKEKHVTVTYSKCWLCVFRHMHCHVPLEYWKYNTASVIPSMSINRATLKYTTIDREHEETSYGRTAQAKEL